MMHVLGRDKKGVLDIITTAILLVSFIVVIVFLTVSIYIIQLEGNAAGKVLLKVSVGSTYDEQRNILYLTDEYGNRIIDKIGEALLIHGAETTLPGNPSILVPGEAIDNAEYSCPSTGTSLGTYDPEYNVKIVDTREYMHCYVMPMKLSKMYGTERYCIYVVYDEGGTNIYTIYGNSTLDCASEKKITADLAAPPGYDKPIYLRLKKI